MKSQKRASRRQHRKRIRKNMLNRNQWWIDETTVHKFIDNRKPCSCWMCGNQRKHHGVPFSEQAEIKFLTIGWGDAIL